MSSVDIKATPRKSSSRAKTNTDQLVRLNVNLNSETADALKEIADHRGISFTEAVRRAISVYKFIDEETQEGRRIQTVSPDRSDVRELVLM
ncbi:CopG family transcriptional regulator (plasmid) [Frondihabitans sp. PAMC 28766]|uniref:ribbon-helix-helix protein, CopG family n=1 Tax=Frondihabitans sp. PAMC 28766 TaxID=1795630 RepID=UPI00078DC5BA|nr:ribbon-helix-helix protein, CopG family [Frondihabitans sp. PAMC 28766]AMM22779.1 CopG family transcriptional regulator [Frondihabitans sp. PAMC 28766]